MLLCFHRLLCLCFHRLLCFQRVLSTELLPEGLVYRVPCVHELPLAPLRTRAPPPSLKGKRVELWPQRGSFTILGQAEIVPRSRKTRFFPGHLRGWLGQEGRGSRMLISLHSLVIWHTIELAYGPGISWNFMNSWEFLGFCFSIKFEGRLWRSFLYIFIVVWHTFGIPSRSQEIPSRFLGDS